LNLVLTLMTDEAGEIDLLSQTTHHWIYAQVQSGLWVSQVQPPVALPVEEETDDEEVEEEADDEEVE